MKIAIDIREACKEKTGKGYYTFNLVQEILKQDQENHYLLYTDSSLPHKAFHTKNSRIKQINSTSIFWHFKVLQDLKKEKPDLFFAPTSYIIPAFAPKKIKTIITVHDLVAFLFPRSHNKKAVFIERFTLKKALTKAIKVFTVSNNSKKDLLEKFNYPEKDIVVIPCAISDFLKIPATTEHLKSFQQKHEIPENFILGVSTLEPRKNFETLIRSFVIIKRKLPDYKLVIVGRKGWKYDKIEHALKKFHLEKDVIFTGYLNDEELKYFYSLAKVFVFPSLYEGFGMPPLEAMACGCPVVSSNAASLPEVIGDAGLLVSPKNAHHIADAVISLIENEKAREMLIKKGYERVQDFSWEKSAFQAIRAFETL